MHNGVMCECAAEIIVQHNVYVLVLVWSGMPTLPPEFITLHFNAPRVFLACGVRTGRQRCFVCVLHVNVRISNGCNVGRMGGHHQPHQRRSLMCLDVDGLPAAVDYVVSILFRGGGGGVRKG